MKIIRVHVDGRDRLSVATHTIFVDIIFFIIIIIIAVTRYRTHRSNTVFRIAYVCMRAVLRVTMTARQL